MRSELHIRLRRHANGVVAASGSLAVPPYWCRWDGTTLWLVGSAATPVGDDDISLHLEVGEGVTATVRSVAATVVYAASGDGTRLHTHLRVGAGADLRWQPDPVIVTARARHRSSTTIEVDPEGSLLADELVVLGRSDERAGRFRGSLELRLGGAPALHTSFDTAVPGWDGPGGTGGAKVVATRVLVDPLDARPHPEAEVAPTVSARAVLLRPERGGAVITALATGPTDARAALDELSVAAGGRRTADLLTV